MADENTEDTPGGAHAGKPGPENPDMQKVRSGCSCGGLAGIVLLALAILGLMGWLSFPSGFGNRWSKPGLKRDPMRTLTQSLVNAIKGYYMVYSHYPFPPGHAGDETVPLRTDSFLTKVLAGEDKTHNPEGISFLPEFKAVKPGKGFGLMADGSKMWIVDKWSEPLYIIMDADGDNTIANPNPHSTNIRLHVSVIVFSAGPDKDPNTWEDNIMSWESGKKK